jgi:hypothetical protein
MSVPAQNSTAFNPRQPFSRAEARAVGLTAEMLLSRRFHKIFWDAYVAREVHITPLLRAKAVIRLVPDGTYISHHTAAELWGAVRTLERVETPYWPAELWVSGEPSSQNGGSTSRPASTSRLKTANVGV